MSTHNHNDEPFFASEEHRQNEQKISDYFRDRRAKAREQNDETEKHRRQLRLEELHEIGRGIGEGLAASLPKDVRAATVKKAANLGD